MAHLLFDAAKAMPPALRRITVGKCGPDFLKVLPVGWFSRCFIRTARNFCIRGSEVRVFH